MAIRKLKTIKAKNFVKYLKKSKLYLREFFLLLGLVATLTNILLANAFVFII